MNNLLRTLTESRVKPTGDLKLLLTAVKETRKQSYDAKLSDAFYDSLDNLLSDLRTISIDNRDAEAFLKPVSRVEVPDYYDYITNPMDFTTMARKLKAKQYKSKREFKADLDLIWSNCYKYNAAEDHPLRQCADRLKVKAERLLKYITDRKDRTDPQIPPDLNPQSSSSSTIGIARPKVNGSLTNGHRRGVSSSNSSLTHIPSTPRPQPTASTSSTSIIIRKKQPRVQFADTPALLRTPEGMAAFRELDRGLLHGSTSAFDKVRTIAQRPPVVVEEDEDDLAQALGAVTGDKRKKSPQGAPRKKARFAESVGGLDDPALWWDAVLSERMIANGIPEIPYASSSSASDTVVKAKGRRRRATKGGQAKGEGKEREREREREGTQHQSKSLLTLMNNNIKTMRRMRGTHAKIVVLAAASAPAVDEDGMPIPGADGVGATASMGSAIGGVPVPPEVPPEGEDVVGEMDERHWIDIMREATIGSVHGLGKGKGKAKRLRAIPSGVEFGEANAHACTRWVGEKVLEHVGFQGASSGALEILTNVMGNYLENVGRTLKYLQGKFADGPGSMSAEEIILHTLFESGVGKVQDLEKYITDEVERSGARLLDLEKKLVGVYREFTAGGELLEDEGLFDEESEDETPALAMGDFADALNEDYLGLRESGIAAEFNLLNLSIPKALLKRKKQLAGGAGVGGAGGPGARGVLKKKEKPLDYPLPPDMPKFVYGDLPGTIGILKGYYEKRFAERAEKVQKAQSAAEAANAGAVPGSVGAPPAYGMSALPGPVIGGGMARLAGPVLPGPPKAGVQSGGATVAAAAYPPNPYPTASSGPTDQLPSMPATTVKPPQPPVQATSLASGQQPLAMGAVPSVLVGSPGVYAAQLKQAPISTPVVIPADLELPDDAPGYLQSKMGPLGQIAVSKGGAGGASGAKSKKSGAASSAGPGGGGGGAGAGAGGGGAGVPKSSSVSALGVAGAPAAGGAGSTTIGPVSGGTTGSAAGKAQAPGGGGGGGMGGSNGYSNVSGGGGIGPVGATFIPTIVGPNGGLTTSKGGAGGVGKAPLGRPRKNANVNVGVNG